jgi:hypothetical protein
MTEGRYETLKRLLPPVDSPYSVDILSAAETAALEEALHDGFGYRGVGSKEFPFPFSAEGEMGLRSYSWFQADYSAYDPEEEREAPPSGGFPLKFKIDRLGPYFDNQLNRFKAYLVREEPDYGTSMHPWRAEILAREWTFKKPWYEFHATRFLLWIDQTRDRLSDSLSAWDLALCGQLGRLVEQYYWKFRFERAAISGVDARNGASRGGKVKSEGDRARQTEWQRRAIAVWQSHPNWSKLAVAGHIKKQLSREPTTRRNVPTARHIARYINEPT